MDDVSAVVQDAKLTDFPGFVFQFSVWMNDIQSIELFIEIVNFVHTDVAACIFRYAFVVAFPEVNFYVISDAHQVVWPIAVAGETQLLIKSHRFGLVQEGKDGDG